MSTVTTSNKEKATAIKTTSDILKAVMPQKLMKKFTRNVNDNGKLDRFLSGEVKLPKAFDPAELRKVIDKLLDPTTHEHHGLVNIDQQRQILDLLEQDVLAIEIAQTQTWLASFKLDDEQKDKASTKLVAYEKLMRSAITKGITEWRKVYGKTESPE